MTRSAIRYRSLLLVGICLPAALALANQQVLSIVSIPTLSTFSTALLFGFYAIQIACVSWLVGRYIEPWPLRWVIWVWIMALVDLQLAVMTASIFSHAVQCLATGVLAGQCGVLVVWGILGSGPIVWRVPSLLVLLIVCGNCYALLIRVSLNFSWLQLSWHDLLVVESVSLAALCGVLRLWGYSLSLIAVEGDGGRDQSNESPPLQFGIRDVLIGTTFLAVLLGIAKAGDLLNVQFIQRAYAVGFGFVATVAVSSAAVLLVAIWAALGRGNATLRILVLVLASLTVGAPLAWYAVHVGQPKMILNLDYRFAHWYAIGYWWIGWMCLAATLLAASLMIFRTLGYRLVWVPRPARPL